MPIFKSAPARLLRAYDSLAGIRALTGIAPRDGGEIDQVPSIQP